MTGGTLAADRPANRVGAILALDAKLVALIVATTLPAPVACRLTRTGHKTSPKEIS